MHQASGDERAAALALLEAQGWRSQTIREALVDANTELRYVDATTAPSVARPVDLILRDVRIAADRSPKAYLTAKDYNRFRPEGAVTATRLTQRFGSWKAATTAAGVAVAINSTGRLDRSFTDDELVGWVARFVHSSSQTTWALFMRWARATEGAPSSSLVRGRMGTWDGARQQAITALERR
ncbi:hypothetical protein [Tessaracoccus sp.]